MIELYNKTADEITRLTTHRYSTSFTLGIKAFDKAVRRHIYAIYAWSRFTDEIVDTFLDRSVVERREILSFYKEATYRGIHSSLSPFPVIHAFQQSVNEFSIPLELVDSFFKSMDMDLENTEHSSTTYAEYIYGSAEVIGLMCLRVFVKGDMIEYERLKEPARKLGSAFQKVNFLRDMKSDYEERGRVYFPKVNFSSFGIEAKRTIEADIEKDFLEAYEGILQLPKEARKGVYLAYKYYYSLFKKIRRANPHTLQMERVRIPDLMKLVIMTKTKFRAVLGSY